MRIKEKTWKYAAGVLLAAFISVFSIFICANKVAEAPFFSSTTENLEDTKATVMKLSASTLAVSVAITLLPDDYATPLADSLADMTKYFVLILGTVFLEKLMVTEGVPIAFRYVVPVACLLFLLYFLTKKELFKSFATKVTALALALILVVPCGIHLAEFICEDSLIYVEETIDSAEEGMDKIDEITEPVNEDKSWYDNISGIFQTAISGVKDLFDYFSNIVKKCINATAILIIVSCVIPVLTFLFFVWILNQLFQLQTLQFVTGKVAALTRAEERKRAKLEEKEA